MTTKFSALDVYSPNHIRVIAHKLANKYENLERTHVFWIAKKLDIYPDGIPYKTKKAIDMTKMGKINKANSQYVENGNVSDAGVRAIETFLISEGYTVKKDYGEEKMPDTKSVWEQVDLISAMKQDYEKVVAERDEAKAEAQENFELLKQYEVEIDELKDRLLIYEKENNDLKAEKKELGKMQFDKDFAKEIDNLQVRVGKYNQEINLLLSDMSILRKDYSALQTKMNQMQDSKKKLDGVLSDLVGCSKRLMNLK